MRTTMQGPIPGPISNQRLVLEDGVTAKQEGLEKGHDYRGVNHHVRTKLKNDKAVVPKQ